VDAFIRSIEGAEENYLVDTYLVMIELENNRDTVHEEMWKLIHWRVPLKALIFYDFSLDDRVRKPKCASWLHDKCIPGLERMLEGRIQSDCDGEYMLVVGSREGDAGGQSEQIRWRFFQLTPQGRLAEMGADIGQKSD